MLKNSILKKHIYIFGTLILMMASLTFTKLEVKAVDFPNINVSFDTADESVIVDGIPSGSSDGLVEYQLEGYLNYESERIETFCYAPNVRACDVSDKMAYIFNWSGDKERFLPCTGEYKFTTYVTARYKDAQGKMIEESGPKTTISITLHKKDESTNWGPGLPNTTVEVYDLGQIKGKDTTIKIEEAEYTWSIYGKDIVNVPENNVSLKITANPELFQNIGVDDYFGDTLALRMNIEHNGEFGFQAILDYKIGERYAGKYANLFYVVGDGSFEYVGGAIVGENGVASFAFTHASDYVIAITDVEYTGQKLNVSLVDKSEEMQTDSTPSDSNESSKTEMDKEETFEIKTELDEEKTEEFHEQTNVVNTALESDNTWIVIGCSVLVVLIICGIVLIKRIFYSKSENR